MVDIEYVEAIPQSRQGAEFYVKSYGHERYATLTKDDRKLHIDRVGDMYLTIPNLINGELEESGKIITDTDELLEAGIKDDIQLRQVLKTLGYAGWAVYHQNPYWEIVSDYDPDGVIGGADFYEAVDEAIKLLDDENFWEGMKDFE